MNVMFYKVLLQCPLLVFKSYEIPKESIYFKGLKKT